MAGGMCSRKEKLIQKFGELNWRKETTLKLTNSWESNVKMERKGTGWTTVDGIYLANDRESCGLF